jgi:hypothetical protein
LARGGWHVQVIDADQKATTAGKRSRNIVGNRPKFIVLHRDVALHLSGRAALASKLPSDPAPQIDGSFFVLFAPKTTVRNTVIIFYWLGELSAAQKQRLEKSIA